MAMQKYAVRGGHNFTVQGASSIISETKEDRLVKDAVIKYLKAAGKTVLDVTSPDSCGTVMSDLSHGVNKANDWGADFFISIHFNNAYSHYNGAIGSEVYCYRDIPEAHKAQQALVSLGFKNRGVKTTTNLYELRHTDMPSMLIEVCFVEATEDVALYKKLGPDMIGKTIVEHLLSTKLESSNPVTSTPAKPSAPTPDPLWKNSISGDIVKRLQSAIGVTVDGYFGTDTLHACPIIREGSRAKDVNKIVQERLLAIGYTSLKQHGGADGIFGAGTTTAVKNFQKNRNLGVDGIVGPETWKQLFAK